MSLILLTLPNDSCLDVQSGFRYYFILFLHLVTFAHVFHWVFKASGLAEVEYKQYYLWRWLTSAILKKKDGKDTQSVIQICSDHLTNFGPN